MRLRKAAGNGGTSEVGMRNVERLKRSLKTRCSEAVVRRYWKPLEPPVPILTPSTASTGDEGRRGEVKRDTPVRRGRHVLRAA